MILKETSSEKHIRFTYAEFVNNAKNAKQSEKAKNAGARSSRKEASEWNGNMSFEKACETAVAGWDAGLKQLALTDGILSESGVKYNPNVCGSVVNIGNYLLGLPDNMWELKSESEFSLPQITIYVNLSYNAGNSGVKAMNFCNEIAGRVNEYQKNHNVRLIGIIANTQSDGLKYFTEIVIKDYDQRFVLNNVCFAFHPSFFRKLWFAQVEAESFIETWGYGQPFKTNDIISKLRKEYMSEKTILYPCLTDLGENGKFNDNQIITLKE